MTEKKKPTHDWFPAPEPIEPISDEDLAREEKLPGFDAEQMPDLLNPPWDAVVTLRIRAGALKVTNYTQLVQISDQVEMEMPNGDKWVLKDRGAHAPRKVKP